MQLKIQRSQRPGGVLGGTIVFALDVRADYSSEEQDNIRRYKLGGQVIYNSQAARKHLDHAGTHLDRTQAGSVGERAAGLARGAFSMAMAKMSLNISIASLGRGHHIECKDLDELLEAEETVREACKGVTRYLEIASTFDGSEMVIEYDKGEERIHFTQNAPPLIEYHPEPRAAANVASSSPPSEALREMGQDFARLGKTIKNRWLALQKKIAEFAASKGWDLNTLPTRVGDSIQSRWLSFEKMSVEAAASKGVEISAVHVRAACGTLSLAVLAFLIAFKFA